MEVQLDKLYKILCDKIVDAFRPSITLLYDIQRNAPSYSSPEYRKFRQLDVELAEIYSRLVDITYQRIKLKSLNA